MDNRFSKYVEQVNKIIYLGIILKGSIKNIVEENYKNILDNIRTLVNKWNKFTFQMEERLSIKK